MAYKISDKTEQRKDEKRRLILRTAADVFSEKGYHKTSVKDITDTAGISVGTFYLYFKNKEDLFEKLYDEVALRINKAEDYVKAKKAASPAERFTNVYVSTLWTYERHRELAKIMMIEAVGLNPRFEEKYAGLMSEACEKMDLTFKHLREIGIIEVPDTLTAAIAHEGVFQYAVSYWLRNNNINLREQALPLAVFTLQALKMDFNPDDIRKSMAEMFKELDRLPAGYF